MSQLQKYALWNLCVMGLGMVLFAASIPFVGLKGAPACFSVCALWAFGAYILRTRRDGKVTMDERDRQIWGVSLAAGYAVFWLAFVFGCMIPAHIYGWNGSMPVEILALYLPIGATIITVTQSVAILVQYACAGDSHAAE